MLGIGGGARICTICGAQQLYRISNLSSELNRPRRRIVSVHNARRFNPFGALGMLREGKEPVRLEATPNAEEQEPQPQEQERP